MFLSVSHRPAKKFKSIFLDMRWSVSEEDGDGNPSRLRIERSLGRCDAAAVNQDLEDVTEPAIKVV